MPPLRPERRLEGIIVGGARTANLVNHTVAWKSREVRAAALLIALSAICVKRSARGRLKRAPQRSLIDVINAREAPGLRSEIA